MNERTSAKVSEKVGEKMRSWVVEPVSEWKK